MAKTSSKKPAGPGDAKERERRLRSRIARLKEKISSTDAAEQPAEARLARKGLKRTQRKLNRWRREMERRTPPKAPAKAASPAAEAKEAGSESGDE